MKSLKEIFKQNNVSSVSELKQKIEDLKEDCLQNGIYEEVFGDIHVIGQNRASFCNGAIGVNFSAKKTGEHYSLAKQNDSPFDELDDFTKNLVCSLVVKYKDNKEELQTQIIKTLKTTL